jgi:hypothetical protein
MNVCAIDGCGAAQWGIYCKATEMRNRRQMVEMGGSWTEDVEAGGDVVMGSGESEEQTLHGRRAGESFM